MQRLRTSKAKLILSLLAYDTVRSHTAFYYCVRCNTAMEAKTPPYNQQALRTLPYPNKTNPHPKASNTSSIPYC